MLKIKYISLIIAMFLMITMYHYTYYGSEYQIISEKMSSPEEEIQPASPGGHKSTTSEDDDNATKKDDVATQMDSGTKSSNDVDDNGTDIYKQIPLWPNDPNCSSYTVGVPKQPSGVWVLTAPRSGTDWTLYLLEASTGKYSTTIYLEGGLQPVGFYGLSVKPDSIPSSFTKIHTANDLNRHRDWPVVSIIRNPMREIVSYYNFEIIAKRNRSERFTASVDEKLYSTEDFHSFVQSKVKIWMAIYKYALQHIPRLHVVFYEYLRENPIEEVRKMLEFLEYNIDKERLSCVAKHVEGYRKGAQRNINPYTQQETVKIRQAIKKIDQLLKKRGFPSLPDYKKYVV